MSNYKTLIFTSSRPTRCDNALVCPCPSLPNDYKDRNQTLVGVLSPSQPLFQSWSGSHRNSLVWCLFWTTAKPDARIVTLRRYRLVELGHGSVNLGVYLESQVETK
ncbi:unnamed protein product [Microthlaspi erraticum]|uniref:Uncharacterized protein n=1 Tax=Microthlaspi erraticum TaxID=1685480 RepID=A0A6D2IN93_9BRAS|nr:unnamed protein product [Microthlaspi erraticum]